MSDIPSSRRAGRPHRAEGASPRRIVLWVVLVIILILVAAVGWVGIRALIAKRDLTQAVMLVGTLKSEIIATNTSQAVQTAKTLQQKADDARSLTSDPVWRAAEITPLIGSDLRAVRQIASVVDSVSSDAVTPLASRVGGMGTATFKPVNGKLNLQPLVAAAPVVAKATEALQQARVEAAQIGTKSTLSAIDTAIGQLQTELTSTSAQLETVNRVVQLVPSMLAVNGQRNYLLLFQNDAELRAGGGIPGAVALVHIADGRISLQNEAAGAEFGPYTAPVLPLATDTKGLYGRIAGEYMQDVTLTPRFETSAELAKAMWAKKFGTQVDGVVAVDPVTLGYMLKATGPISLPTGDILTSKNAAALLLSTVYAKYVNTQFQDAFFASAASAVFAKISSGAFDPHVLISALTMAAGEGRVLVWSATPSEEKLIAPTAVATLLPQSTSSNQQFGVYLNDATGAKMDYYLTTSSGVGRAQCRKDGRPTWVATVTLTNTAPANAASSLPEYVTGGGHFGVQPGLIRTNVAIYAPKSGVFVGASQDGQSASPQTTSDGSYPVVQFQTLLRPGQTTTLRVEFLGARNLSKAAVSIGGTPGVHPTVTKGVVVTCENPLQ